MANSVNTVTGAISLSDLGNTLMHEHLLVGFTGWFADNTRWPFDRGAALKKSLKAMEDIKACGVKTYVDATTNDMGRDVMFMKEVSEKSGVNIVCSTALYTEEKGAPFYFRRVDALGGEGCGVREISELFETEITKGIENTGVKAGVIKVATGMGAITPYEEMILTAAARAQKATGVPIITHTEEGTMGPEQADLLISEGANPRQVMIGHSGGSGDLRYHASILNRGVYLAFDRMGLNYCFSPPTSDSLRIACVLGLMSMGYADKLIFSHDCCLNFLGKPADLTYVKEVVKDWYPTHVFKDIIPVLKGAGVTDDQLNTVMVENPRKIFQG